MTQYQLYMKSGVPRSNIGNIINCSYDSVKLRIIHEMCQGLGIGIDTFLLLHFSRKIIWNHKTSDELRRRSYYLIFVNRFLAGFLSRFCHGWPLLSAHGQKERAAVFVIENSCSVSLYSVAGLMVCSANGNVPKRSKTTALPHLQFFLVLRKRFLEWNRWSYLQHSIHIFPDCKIAPTLFLPIRYLFFGLTLSVQQLVLRFLLYWLLIQYSVPHNFLEQGLSMVPKTTARQFHLQLHHIRCVHIALQLLKRLQ